MDRGIGFVPDGLYTEAARPATDDVTADRYPDTAHLTASCERTRAATEIAPDARHRGIGFAPDGPRTKAAHPRRRT
ncbi:hypothetical protein [Streptomyces sp. WM6386]|uniref:hypothetical protein n=1 Tax=Streptomyces sp. WM6386 TaxID=1415558 RepID=UPI000619E787|nr:hypothetical protein [Streptomyces sp. WM6386]KKD07787.1 hypothetical protein TN53_11485 [Streptomyces sp. WM6386]